MAVCNDETDNITRQIAKLHRIRWTIENFSELSENDEINGPDVRFMGKCVCRIYLIKKKNILMIKLQSFRYKGIRIIKSKFVLLDCDGTKLNKVSGKSMTFEGEKYITLREESFSSLKDDKLIIDICLKVNHLITTSNYLKFETESQKELINDLKMFCNSAIGSDFTIQIGQKFIHAHKIILSCRSEYFKSMFETQMKENSQNSVVVTDVSYSTMKKLVEFLYIGDFTITEEDNEVEEIMNLYVAADKYQVLNLRCVFAEKLVFFATADNILEILQLAERHNDEHMKLEAMKVVSFHFDKVLIMPAFKTLSARSKDLAIEILEFCSKNDLTIFVS